MKLLWIDTETTGLDPHMHRLLEVAAFVTDLRDPFNKEGAVVTGVLPVIQAEVDGWDPFITDMHAKNGLTEACLASAGWSVPSQSSHSLVAKMRELEESLLEIIPLKKDVDKEDVTVLAGSTVHFDLGFLRVYMPELASNLSHRVYDVSAIKLFCRSLGMEKIPSDPDVVGHRALADALSSLDHARRCAAWLKGK